MQPVKNDTPDTIEEAKSPKPGMTYIPIREHAEFLNAEKKPLSTVDILWEIVKTPPAGGASYEDMAPRMKVWTALDELTPGSTVIELKASDFANFGKIALAFKFKIVDKFVFDFLHQFKQ